MKFLASLLVLVSLNSYAVTLSCSTGECRDVEKPVNSATWCEKDMSFLDLDGNYNLSGLNLNSENGKFEKVYSDGDQYTIVSFDAEKAQALKVGETITGEFSDNFWWRDGDHTRFTVDLNCTRVK